MQKSLFQLLIVFLVFGATACGEDVLGGPEIVSVAITPSTISLAETGMTDEFFTVTVTLADFDDVTAGDVTVFRSEPSQVDAEPGSRTLSGDTVTFDQIAKSWFTGVDAGTYDIGVEVVTASGTRVRELDTASVTVEP